MVQEADNEGSIDIKKILYKLLGYWYYFFISVFLCVSAGYFYTKTISPQYEVSTSILIPENKELLNPEDLLGLASLKSESKVENEIGLLKTYSIVDQTIRSLPFNIAYFQKKIFRDTELYQSAPFDVEMDAKHLQATGIDYTIQILNSSEYILKTHPAKTDLYSFEQDSIVQEDLILPAFEKKYSFGEVVEKDGFKFVLKKNKRFEKECLLSEYSFKFFTTNALVNAYRNFTINRDAKSSILTLTIRGQSPRKCSDFLNRLSSVYLSKGTEQKAKVADATINFINSQLLDIVDSLDFSEKNLQDFRTNNSAIEMDFQTQQSIKGMDDLEKQKAEISAKNRYYLYLQDYLKKSSNIDDIIAPSSMGIADPLLGSLIMELSKLYAEKAEMKFNSKKGNPMLDAIEQKIAETKSTLSENIVNILNASKMSMEDIDKRLKDMSSKLSDLPTTQRKLLTYERKSKLNGDLYTFLLQKRSESQIAKASNIPENQVIDRAVVINSKMVSPKKMINLAVSFLLGLLIPSLIIYLADFFGEKIYVAEDVERSVKLPFLGYVVHNENQNDVAFSEPHSVIAESFRGIRTNCEFIGKGVDNKVILITSTVSGEGKTFFSLNIAIGFALYEKKTLLLCYDLRKPVVYEDIDTEQKMGLSSYLSGKVKLEEIVQSTKYENLSVILPGVIPPNPTELLASKRTTELFEILKQQYDTIIIDTPPIGVLSDALLLVKFSDVNIFLARHNYTNKRLFVSVVEDLQKKELSNFHVVLNDMDIRKNLYRYGYSYKYGYGYGYGYGKYGKYGAYGKQKRRTGILDNLSRFLGADSIKED